MKVLVRTVNGNPTFREWSGRLNIMDDLKMIMVGFIETLEDSEGRILETEKHNYSLRDDRYDNWEILITDNPLGVEIRESINNTLLIDEPDLEAYLNPELGEE